MEIWRQRECPKPRKLMKTDPRHMHAFNFMYMSCLVEPNETKQLHARRQPGLFGTTLLS